MYRSETSPFKAIERKIWIDLWAQFLIITFHNVYRLFNLEFSKWFAKDFAFIGTLKLQDIRSFTDILHLHLLYTENIPSYEYFYLFLSLSFFFLSLFKLLYLQHSYNYFFFFLSTCCDNHTVSENSQIVLRWIFGFSKMKVAKQLIRDIHVTIDTNMYCSR